MPNTTSKQLETGGRFRKKRNNFSMVSNTLIQDDSVSLKAKGLYALIQSYITIDGFTLYKGFLLSKCAEGKKAFESAWKELKEAGYLIQYKMQNPDTKQFFYEYDLLDAPETVTRKPITEENTGDNRTPDSVDQELKPDPQKGVCGSGSMWLRDDMEKGGCINNTKQSNTLKSNILSNHINSYPHDDCGKVSERKVSLDEVKEQIGYSALDESDQAEQIALLIQEVLNMPDSGTIRVSMRNIPAADAKERFRMLDMFHVQYLLDCINANEKEVANMKTYLLTSLYNAPATISAYYSNKVTVNRSKKKEENFSFWY